MKCKECGSKAINPGYNERGQDMMNLCDACYWKKKYELLVTEKEAEEKEII